MAERICRLVSHVMPSSRRSTYVICAKAVSLAMSAKVCVAFIQTLAVALEEGHVIRKTLLLRVSVSKCSN